MANTEQALARASPVRTDEQIVPRNRWVPIGKSNCYLNEEKSQRSPIFKIAVDILKQTNFFRAFTASSTIPAIYIQQFWDTIRFDSKAGSFKCQLDEQWFNLNQDTLRDALQITPTESSSATNFFGGLSIELTLTMLKGCGRNSLNPSKKVLLVREEKRVVKGRKEHLHRRQKEVGTTYSGKEESNSYSYSKYQVHKIDHIPPATSAQLPPKTRVSTTFAN
ncbi:hypothetical protein Tco_1191946 [Tanacetum coccineum]